MQALRSTLFVTLRTNLLQAAAPSASPAVHDYAAYLQVQWSPDDGPDVDLAALSELAHFDAEAYFPEVDRLLPDTVVIPVGQGGFVAADLTAPTCWAELASRGLDLGLVGEGLLGEAFDLSALRAAYDLVHERAIIVNSMEVAPEWRGAGYGLLAIELVLAELGRSADVAALFPMQPGLTDLTERAAAGRALAEYWGRLGFVDFNGIMVRDLSSSSTEAVFDGPPEDPTGEPGSP